MLADAPEVGRLALAVTVICGAGLLDQDATTGRLTG